MAKGIKFFFKMRGLEDIVERLEILKDADPITQQLATQLFEDASRIIDVSQRLVPVKTGNLRATGHVQIPVIHGTIVTCFFGYGGPSAPYAIYVHENLRARHTNGVAKYLEIPYLQYVSGALAHFSAELRASRAIGRAFKRLG